MIKVLISCQYQPDRKYTTVWATLSPEKQCRAWHRWIKLYRSILTKIHQMNLIQKALVWEIGDGKTNPNTFGRRSRTYRQSFEQALLKTWQYLPKMTNNQTRIWDKFNILHSWELNGPMGNGLTNDFSLRQSNCVCVHCA